MQEQPPSDPSRREPRAAARRGRAPKPTFTPPTVPPADPDPTAGQPEPAGQPARQRRRTPAPDVLFQPPESGSPAEQVEPPLPTPRRTARQKNPAATPGSTTAKKAPAPKTAPPKTTTPKTATPRTTAPRTTAPKTDASRKPADQVTETPTPPVVPVQGVAAHAREATPTGRTVDLDRILADPGFTPELLALAAVERIGPQARAWADGLLEAYPQAGPDGLARLATRRFVRLAGVGGATAAFAGLFAPLAELAAVLWTQAGLVLHLAAAHGRDPADPERAVELLVLTRVHPDAESARAALAAARSAAGGDEPPWGRVAEAAWRLATPLAAQAGGWLALRVASRLLPGAAVLVAAAGDSATAERLAARTIAAYRSPEG